MNLILKARISELYGSRQFSTEDKCLEPCEHNDFKWNSQSQLLDPNKECHNGHQVLDDYIITYKYIMPF